MQSNAPGGGQTDRGQVGSEILTSADSGAEATSLATAGGGNGSAASSRAHEGNAGESATHTLVLGELLGVEPVREPSYAVSGKVATGISAITVAAVTSYIGTQGTVIGVAIGAMLGSVVTQLAKPQLMRCEQRIHQAAAAVGAARLRDIPGYVRAAPAGARALHHRIPMRTVGIASGLGVAGFVVAMGSITALEVSQGEPLSAITTGEPSTGTTISNLSRCLATRRRSICRRCVSCRGRRRLNRPLRQSRRREARTPGLRRTNRPSRSPRLQPTPRQDRCQVLRHLLGGRPRHLRCPEQ